MGGVKSVPEKPAAKRKCLEEVYFKGEQLFQVSDSQMQEHRYHQCIGVLVSYTEDGKQSKATGFLVAPNIVLTGTHALFDENKKNRTRNHRFYPAANGQLKKYYEIEAIYQPQEYQLIKDLEFDFALLKLNQRIPDNQNKGYLALGLGFNDLSALISIFGYPGDDNFKPCYKDGSNRIVKQKGLEKNQKLIKIEGDEISYKISTGPGQSGSPLVTGQFRNIVVGIHIAGVKDGNEEYNIARYVNIGLIVRLEIWREKCNGDKFTVIDYETNTKIELQTPLFEEMKNMLRTNQLTLLREIKERDEEICAKSREMENLRQQINVWSEYLKQDLQQLLRVNQQLKEKDAKNKADLQKTLDQLKETKKINQQLNQKLAYCLETQTDKYLQSLLRFKNETIQTLRTQKIQLEQKIRNKKTISLISPASFQNLIQSIKKSLQRNAGDPPIDARNILEEGLKTLKNQQASFLFQMIKYNGKHQICSGLLCKRNDKEVQQSRIMRINESQIGDSYNNICFVPESEKFQMVVDLSSGQLTFKDVRGNSFYTEKSKKSRSPMKRKVSSPDYTQATECKQALRSERLYFQNNF